MEAKKTSAIEKFSNTNPSQLFMDDLLSVMLDKNKEAKSIAKSIKSMCLSNTSLEVNDLQTIEHITKREAFQIATAIELGKRVSTKVDPMSSLTDPETIWEKCADFRNASKEHFMVFYLNTRDKEIARELISIGTVSASMVHPREVFRGAVTNSASTIIGVHNHPSGEVTPSDADVRITQRLVEAGKILGIEFYDHIIVTEQSDTTKEKWYSLRDEQPNIFQ